MSLGPAEILVIMVLALLVFGPQRLPEIGKQVGRGVREFRKFQQSVKGDLDSVFADDVSDRAEPAPTLPPKPAIEPAPAEPAAHAPAAGTPAGPDADAFPPEAGTAAPPADDATTRAPTTPDAPTTPTE